MHNTLQVHIAAGSVTFITPKPSWTYSHNYYKYMDGEISLFINGAILGC